VFLLKDLSFTQPNLGNRLVFLLKPFIHNGGIEGGR